MSHSKPMHSFGSDLDDALEELYADFDKKYNIPSTAHPISSQQSKRQKPSAKSTHTAMIIKICIAVLPVN